MGTEEQQGPFEALGAIILLITNINVIFLKYFFV